MTEYENIYTCHWCGEDYEESEIIKTDIGFICKTCLHAITSRGEKITVEYE